MRLRTLSLLVIVPILFSGCVLNRVELPSGDTMTAYMEQVSDQCHVQPQLDWCRDGR